jgi:hypothetical protein
MSCSTEELKDYFLQELAPARQELLEAHLKGCAECREELNRLRTTGAALFALRDEEIPQRIAFVSDPVFEPSAARRFFGAFWGSPARLGFASAAMLSVSLVYVATARFDAGRPAPAPPIAAVQPAAASPAAAEIERRIDEAVTHAVADVEARQTEQTRQLVADFAAKERRYDESLRAIRWAFDETEANRKREQVSRKLALYTQPGAPGEEK